MHTYIAPDERLPLRLYSSHPDESLATSGLQAIVSHSPSTMGQGHVTFCAVLGFPGIPALLPSREASQLAQVLITQVQDTYDKAHQGGIQALEAVLQTLHQYVQFINRDYQAPIRGYASCAEIRKHNLSIACSSGSLNVVLRRDVADIFPLADPGYEIGTVGTLDVKTYEAVLPESGAIFMGSDAWCTFGIASRQAGAARRDLANAVAAAQSPDGFRDVEYFHARNPEHIMLGLLMGMPVADRITKTPTKTFVPPHAPATEPENADSLPADTVADSAIPAAAAATAPGDTVMRSEAETEFTPSASDSRLHIWGNLISQRLMRWLSEIFPDPQANAPMQPASLPVAPAASPPAATPSPVIEKTLPPATPAVPPEETTTPPAGPPRPAPTPELLPREANRPWVAMMLLALFVVVPLASWLAFSVNAESPVASDTTIITQANQHVQAAKNHLASGQNEKAQEQLQLASNLIQASQNAAGLSRQLQSVQLEIRLLWDDAFQLVPLVGLTDPLVQFTAEMAPSKVIVHIQDLYILDSRLHAVYKYRLDALQANGSRNPQRLVQEGDIIDGREVGRIRDMSFQPTKTAYSDKPSLYLIDDNRNILQYNNTDLMSVVDFDQRATWETPVLIDFYSNRMYVADAGQGQIWRYNLNNTVVKQEGWLNESINLSQAIRMHVDEQIWMLFDNNTVLLLGQGDDDTLPANVQKPFGLDKAISFDSRFTDLEVGLNQDNYLLLVDPGLSSILVLDKESGDYQHQLVAPEGADDLFANLKDVYVHRGKIYILTEDSLYEHGFSP